MSLKAKVEAIIYAAEEPITLEQISLLLKDVVLAELASTRENLAIEQADSAAEAAASQATASQESELLPKLEAEAPELISPEPSPAMPQFSEPSETATPANPQPDESGQADSQAPEPDASEIEPGTVAESSEDAPLPAVEPELADSASVATPEAVSRKRQPKKSEQEIAEDKVVRARVREILVELVTDYASEDRGMEIRQVAGGFRMATKPEHHDVVRAFAKSLKPPIRLSLAALETLAVIAYKQPVTGPEISEIRGVESASVLGTLLDRKLITTAGRKQVIGRPMQYKTSKDFLLRFGLNDVNELPSMEEFSQLLSDSSTVEITPSEAEQNPSLFEPDQTEASEPTADAPDEAGAAEAGAPHLPQSADVGEAQAEGLNESVASEPQSTPSPTQQHGMQEAANSQSNSEAESASQPETEHPVGS